MFLAQELPPIDWNTPGVRQVVLVSVIISAALLLFAKMLTPLLERAIRSLGLLKRTWREEMEAKVETNKQNVQTLATSMNVMQAIQNDPASPGPNVPPVVVESTRTIAQQPTTPVPPPIDPAVLPPVPSPEAMGKAFNAAEGKDVT